jgi:DNA modification methylase
MIHVGNALRHLRRLDSESVHCVVTSPPYWGLRDYGVRGQIGLERTPSAYVARLVAVFREVHRVLRADGTLWLNLGDTYASGGRSEYDPDPKLPERGGRHRKRSTAEGSLKPKDLVGIPWLVAFALRADGWWLRQDLVWAKTNSMPESVRDRCTRSHEYLFLLSKSARYYYDADAIAEPVAADTAARYERGRGNAHKYADGGPGGQTIRQSYQRMQPATAIRLVRNRRSVWRLATEPNRLAHFAAFPQALVRPCILAGCPPGGVVLDPFAGAGTVWLVAQELGRQFVGIELNPEYARIARQRVETARERAA